MKYVYPKLSEYDFHFIRFGGAGLGNLMLIYSKALKIAIENNAQIIWPTWPSLKIGPWIRRERDKRFYGDLFENHSGYIDGIKKTIILHRKKRYMEDDIDLWKSSNDAVLIVYKYEMDFSRIYPYRKVIYDDIIRNLKKKNRIACGVKVDAINIHVRLGDFAPASVEDLVKGKDNTSIPVEWYANILKQIRIIIGRDIKAYVFSDGSDDQLIPLLEMNNVERISFGTSIGDIIGLSRGRAIIASGSSFSMWGRFLGNLPAIGYKNQLKESLIEKSDRVFEFELGMNEEFSYEQRMKIASLTFNDSQFLNYKNR